MKVEVDVLSARPASTGESGVKLWSGPASTSESGVKLWSGPASTSESGVKLWSGPASTGERVVGGRAPHGQCVTAARGLCSAMAAACPRRSDDGPEKDKGVTLAGTGQWCSA